QVHRHSCGVQPDRSGACPSSRHRPGAVERAARHGGRGLGQGAGERRLGPRSGVPESAPVLRWAVAGLGTAGCMMLPAILRNPHARLTAGADTDAGALASFARDFQAETYQNVEALCASPHVDAIYIATPTQYHTEHVLLALEHGKHVVIEKPMALN